MDAAKEVARQFNAEKVNGITAAYHSSAELPGNAGITFRWALCVPEGDGFIVKKLMGIDIVEGDAIENHTAHILDKLKSAALEIE